MNNAVYLNYLENAKVAYFREVVGVRRLRAREPIPVPDEWRRRIEAHETESLARA